MRRIKINPKKLLFGIAISSVFVVVLYNTKDIIFGAPLNITSITNGMSVDENYLQIEGKAPHAKTVMINGREIFTNRKGFFSEGVVLSPGYSVLEIGMVDRFGKTNLKKYELMLEEDGKFTLLEEKDIKKR